MRLLAVVVVRYIGGGDLPPSGFWSRVPTPPLQAAFLLVNSEVVPTTPLHIKNIINPSDRAECHPQQWPPPIATGSATSPSAALPTTHSPPSARSAGSASVGSRRRLDRLTSLHQRRSRSRIQKNARRHLGREGWRQKQRRPQSQSRRPSRRRRVLYSLALEDRRSTSRGRRVREARRLGRLRGRCGWWTRRGQGRGLVWLWCEARTAIAWKWTSGERASS